jgi:hypothetical protein
MFINMQKIKHAASKGTFQKAASKIRLKNTQRNQLVLRKSTKMRNHMQMTEAGERAPRMTGTMCSLHFI